MSVIFGFLLVIVVLRWTLQILPSEKCINISSDCKNCKKILQFPKKSILAIRLPDLYFYTTT